MDSNRCISQAIRVRLVRLGKTQNDLADQVGIDQTQFSGYMNGKVGWRLSTLDDLLAPLKWKDLAELANAAEVEREAAEAIATSKVGTVQAA
ncbi:helix-turn-helix domain-containing protein [Bifidobacterium tissieri]|uniref:XRE family transcriptional regulator n=1 Tax=Bifidobacterium tissieri TaxID=1630162 RepID=A0A5M9ZM39_9BIFI|nr:helix-turn-helix transcriptional regulator [Bifidobacterium tissieri]KAA8828644.1 XRE family transcriptional regulator [Bifidobacterium tissieri]KAA8831587.1 XRE family transcriptional regulator [Bifidobacterium tissieri]